MTFPEQFDGQPGLPPVVVTATGDESLGTPVDILDAPVAGSQAIRGSVLRAAGYVIGALLALISAPLVVHYLGVVDFGRYISVVSLIALILGVTEVGLGPLALREYSVREGASRDAFMRSVLGARLVLTTAGVLAATAFAALAGYGGPLVLGTFIAGAGAVMSVMASTLGVALAAQLRVGWLTAIELAGKVLGTLLLIGLVAASGSVVAFVAVGLPVGLVALAVTIPLVRGHAPLRPSVALADLWELLRETLPVAAAVVLGNLYARIVIIVLSVIAVGKPTGNFATAYRVVEVAMGIPFALVGTTFPIMARAADGDRERLKYVMQRVFEVSLIGGVWLSMVVALSAGPITDILARESEARPVAQVLFILAFSLAPVFMNLTYQTCLLSLRRHRDQVLCNGAALIFVVGLAFILIPPFAAIGAAYAVVIGEIFLTSTAATLLMRAHPELRPELRLVPRLAIAAAAAVASTAVRGVPVIVDPAVATIVYFAALAVLGGIPPELRDALARRGDRRP